MGDSYYRFFPGDYSRDTAELSLIEHGAYRVMLDYCYSGEKLPADRARLYRICRAFTKEEQDAVDYVASKYFNPRDDHLVNPRVEKEMQERREYLSKQSEKSKLGVRKRLKNAEKEPAGLPVGEPSGKPKGEPLPSPSPLINEKAEASASAPSYSQSKKKTGYAAAFAQNDAAQIEELCSKVVALSQKNGKSFNPYAAVQKSVNTQAHPRAMLKALTGIVENWQTIKSPWPYFREIVNIESPNCYEQDAIADYKMVKDVLEPRIAALLAGVLKGPPDRDGETREKREQKRKEELRKQSDELRKG